MRNLRPLSQYDHRRSSLMKPGSFCYARPIPGLVPCPEPSPKTDMQQLKTTRFLLLCLWGIKRNAYRGHQLYRQTRQTRQTRRYVAGGVTVTDTVAVAVTPPPRKTSVACATSGSGYMSMKINRRFSAKLLAWARSGATHFGEVGGIQVCRLANLAIILKPDPIRDGQRITNLDDLIITLSEVHFFDFRIIDQGVD